MKTQYQWSLPCSRINSNNELESRIISKQYIIKDQEVTKDYHAFLFKTSYEKNKRDQLLINFNADRINEISTYKELTVFGVKLDAEWILDYNIYYICKKIEVRRLQDSISDLVKEEFIEHLI